MCVWTRAMATMPRASTSLSLRETSVSEGSVAARAASASAPPEPIELAPRSSSASREPRAWRSPASSERAPERRREKAGEGERR